MPAGAEDEVVDGMLVVDGRGRVLMPGLIDPSWARSGPGGFVARYDALLGQMSEEEAQGVAMNVAESCRQSLRG